jgi:hypothetical protein
MCLIRSWHMCRSCLRTKNFVLKIICLHKITMWQLNAVLYIWISFRIFHWSIYRVGIKKNTQKILSAEYKTAVPNVLHTMHKILFISSCLLSVYYNFFIHFSIPCFVIKVHFLITIKKFKVFPVEISVKFLVHYFFESGDWYFGIWF